MTLARICTATVSWRSSSRAAWSTDGGCTSPPGSLHHETFHSWWGRGIKPASQADGWWDEAWNVYHDGQKKKKKGVMSISSLGPPASRPNSASASPP